MPEDQLITLSQEYTDLRVLGWSFLLNFDTHLSLVSPLSNKSFFLFFWIFLLWFESDMG